MVGYRNDQTPSALNLPIGTLPPFNRLLRGNDVKCVTINRQRHITAASLLPLSGHSGHGRNCCSLDPVAIDLTRT
jgi:hypothetical protein